MLPGENLAPLRETTLSKIIDDESFVFVDIGKFFKLRNGSKKDCCADKI
jgi:hypothetical protein